jgi:hypothetical protein
MLGYGGSNAPTAPNTMEDWILGRQPTKADEDKDGEVYMLRFPDGRDSSGGRRDALVSAAHVGPGVPWRHTHIWKPRHPNLPLAVVPVWRRLAELIREALKP